MVRMMIKIQDVLSSWGSEEEHIKCCNWIGILCSNTIGHVIFLHLNLNWYNCSWIDIYIFKGKTDLDIGKMEMLESLNLSRNKISGVIPVGLAQLTFLSVLDLSNNNGEIPSGIQLDSFSASAYAGNSELCGSPIRLCPGDDSCPPLVYKGNKSSDEGDDGIIIEDGFYISMVVGFIVGLLGVVATLLLTCFIF